MKSFQKDEFKFKYETESTVRRKSSSSESHLNFWEPVKSPTLEFPPGIPLQDGLYMDSNFYFQHMISPDVVWKRPKVNLLRNVSPLVSFVSIFTSIFSIYPQLI